MLVLFSYERRGGEREPAEQEDFEHPGLEWESHQRKDSLPHTLSYCCLEAAQFPLSQ